MLNQLLETIIQILTSWVSKFDSHAQHVEDKLDSLDQTASDIETNTEPISDIKDNTGAVITPIQNIKANTDSIAASSQTSANNTTAILNNISTLSTNTGRAAAFAEDCANNTLDIKGKVTTIASDTTNIRATDNNIYGAVNDIKDLLQYYFITNIVTEDSDGVIANFDTDLDDYLQSCKVTIPADPAGYTYITLTKTGKNLIDPSNFVSWPTNFIWGYKNTGFLLRAGYTYTFSFNGTNASSLRLVSVDEQTIYAQATTSNPYMVTYTPTADTLIVFRLWGNGLTGTDFMLEISETVTEYESYNAMTYYVPFGSTITDGAEADLLSGLVKVNTTPASFIQIQPIAVRTYKGVNNIYSDVGTSALTYRETLKHYLDKNNQ